MENERLQKTILRAVPEDEWIHGSHLLMRVMRHAFKVDVQVVKATIRELVKTGQLKHQVKNDDNNKPYTEFRR